MQSLFIFLSRRLITDSLRRSRIGHGHVVFSLNIEKNLFCILWAFAFSFARTLVEVNLIFVQKKPRIEIIKSLIPYSYSIHFGGITEINFVVSFRIWLRWRRMCGYSKEI